MDSLIINSVFKLTGLTRKAFAEKIHVSPQTVSKWLSGESEPEFVNQKIIRVVYSHEVEQAEINLGYKSRP